MQSDRIVSFLPSATELLYEFGIQDRLYGVTHECRYPAGAASKLKVIRSVIDSENMTGREIDEATCRMLHDGEGIFALDEKNLIAADPDLIISQETCQACAAYTDHVDKATEILQKRPIIHSMNPHSLSEIMDSVGELGKVLGMEKRAAEITHSLAERIQSVRELQKDERPNVLAIEWIEPFFTAGHWVPEMIQTAGGTSMIGRTGEHSRRMNYQEIADSDPDVIIMMPCGFDTKRTISEYDRTLRGNREWNLLRAVKDKRVFAVDADSFFSKPSIRTIDGLEILAKIIHPDRFAGQGVSEMSHANVSAGVQA